MPVRLRSAPLEATVTLTNPHQDDQRSSLKQAISAQPLQTGLPRDSLLRMQLIECLASFANLPLHAARSVLG